MKNELLRPDLFFDFAPMKYAMITFTPPPIPIKRPVNKNKSCDVEPTDPSGIEPAKRPTTAMSAILKRTCKRFEKINGTL